MEAMMQPETKIQAEPHDISRLSPAEFFLLKDRIVREARAAQAAAIHAAFAQAMSAGLRWAHLLSSILHDALALRDALLPARERRRTHGPTTATRKQRPC
jgi:hypothetical protein